MTDNKYFRGKFFPLFFFVDYGFREKSHRTNRSLTPKPFGMGDLQDYRKIEQAEEQVILRGRITTLKNVLISLSSGISNGLI